jgi:Mg/Co/Ni transporter MgtE
LITQKKTLGDVADPSVPTCRLDERLDEVQGRIAATGWEMCVVVNDERVVLGRLGRKALGSNIDATVEDVMANGPSTVRPDALLEETAARLRSQGLATALVTTSNGRLVGVARLDQ